MSITPTFYATILQFGIFTPASLRLSELLTTKELLQVDATIVGGVLIFMTLALTSFSEKESSLYRFMITLVTSTVMVPFSLSALYSLYEKHSLAIAFLKIGFAYSIVVAILFVVLSYFGDLTGMLN